MDVKAELNLKSKLLLNNLGSQYKVFSTVVEKPEKRAKCLGNILRTYHLVVEPFFKDENEERVKKIKTSIDNRCTMLQADVLEGKSVSLTEVSNIYEHLKSMITTRRTSLDKIESLWGVTK